MAAKELKFPETGELYPRLAESARLLLGCRRLDYSASRIATAVEDCNAHVLNLNLTDLGEAFSSAEGSDNVIVDLRVSHRTPGAVVRSLERYGYNVLLLETTLPADPRSEAEDPLRQRIDHLFRIIDL